MTGPRTTHMDREAARSVYTSAAIQAFADVERVTTLLARKQAILDKALNGLVDLDRYHTETEQIRAREDAKRAEIEERSAR